MRVPLKWLSEFVTIDVPLEDLLERLPAAGIEVGEIERVGADWDREKHPGRRDHRGAPAPERRPADARDRRLRRGPDDRGRDRRPEHHDRHVRRQGAARALGREARGRLRAGGRLHGAQALEDPRRALRGDGLLGEGAGDQRRARRHPAAARGRRARDAARRLPRRHGAARRADAEPLALPLARRHRARGGGDGLRHARGARRVLRRGGRRRGRAGRGAHRGPRPLRPLLRGGRQRGDDRPRAVRDAPPAAPGRHPADQQRRRRDQLRDVGDRPAAARVRPGHAARRARRGDAGHRRAPVARGRVDDHARRASSARSRPARC